MHGDVVVWVRTGPRRRRPRLGKIEVSFAGEALDQAAYGAGSVGSKDLGEHAKGADVGIGDINRRGHGILSVSRTVRS